MPAPGEDGKAWLHRLLTPRPATPPLPAPERGREKPRDDARPRASASSDALPVVAAKPAAKSPEVAAPAAAPPAAPATPNVGPGKGRVLKNSERMAALRSGLTAQAHDMADAMPRHAPEEARAELSALWRRINALGQAIEQAQRAEDIDALLAQRREGEERER